MKWSKPEKRRLAKSFVFSALVFTALLLWLRPANTLFVLQDAMFMTGLLFVIVAGFSVTAATGLFDMLSFGYSRFAGFFRKSKDKKEGYFEYTQDRVYAIKWEYLIVGLAFWVCSLVLRLTV